MSARVTSSIQILDASSSNAPVDTGRLIVAGTAGDGPVSEPTLIRGMAEYRATFGLRTGGTDLYDCLRLAFANGLAEAVVVRAAGPAAKAATKAVAGLTVTAIYPGAVANGWHVKVESPAGGKPKLILTGPGISERFTGADVAELVAIVNDQSAHITVTGTTITGTGAEADLAGGTGDDANADLTAALETVSADYGVGAVALPGKAFSDTLGTATVAEVLCEHANTHSRLALLSMPAKSTAAAAKTAAKTVSALTGADRAVLLFPRLVSADGTVAELVGVAAGLRARAHALYGPHRSLISKLSGTTPSGVPESEVADDVWQDLDEAGVSVLRTVGGLSRIYGWRLVKPLGGNVNLHGAQHADMLNAIRAYAQEVAENFIGRDIDGRGLLLEQFGSELRAMMNDFATRGGVYARVVDGKTLDPGWIVDVGPSVNTIREVAAGHLKAQIGVRLSPVAEFIHISITAADATAETI